MKLYFYVLCFMFFHQAFVLAENKKNQDQKNHQVEKILTLEISSSINPATLSYLSSGYEHAEKNTYDLIVIKMNTPGGLVSTTKKILTLIGDTNIPTAIWVTPEGASATSAGAIIAAGAHFLAMSNGTNIGAATPIQMGAKDLGEDIRSKAVNDLVALVNSLSQARGRNTELFSEMVKNAASFTAKEAFEKNLIDAIVREENELLNKINNHPIQLIGQEKQIIISPSPQISPFDMDFGQKLLNFFADPNMAYILFLLGAALLYLEFQSGAFIAGPVGAVFIILAGIGFQVLPLNIGALGLIVAAFLLFTMEIFISSHGVLSLAGLCSLVTGSLFLFRTDDAYISVSQQVILIACGIIALVLLILSFYILFDLKKNKQTKKELYTLVGKEGVVVSILESQEEEMPHFYQIKIGGEIWKARSTEVFKINDSCTIKRKINNLTFEI